MELCIFACTVSHPSHCSVSGAILTLGEGDTGQLGLGPDVMERTKPGKVNVPSPIIQVVAGGMHSLCLTSEGEVSEVYFNTCHRVTTVHCRNYTRLFHLELLRIHVLHLHQNCFPVI